jgi:hypothetical protein
MTHLKPISRVISSCLAAAPLLLIAQEFGLVESDDEDKRGAESDDDIRPAGEASAAATAAAAAGAAAAATAAAAAAPLVLGATPSAASAPRLVPTASSVPSAPRMLPGAVVPGLAPAAAAPTAAPSAPLTVPKAPLTVPSAGGAPAAVAAPGVTRPIVTFGPVATPAAAAAGGAAAMLRAAQDAAARAAATAAYGARPAAGVPPPAAAAAAGGGITLVPLGTTAAEFGGAAPVAPLEPGRTGPPSTGAPRLGRAGEGFGGSRKSVLNCGRGLPTASLLPGPRPLFVTTGGRKSRRSPRERRKTAAPALPPTPCPPRAHPTTPTTPVGRRPPGGFQSELEINDFPQQARWKVTHKGFQGDVTDATGSAVTTKGIYVKSGARHRARDLWGRVLGGAAGPRAPCPEREEAPSPPPASPLSTPPGRPSPLLHLYPPNPPRPPPFHRPTPPPSPNRGHRQAAGRGAQAVPAH